MPNEIRGDVTLLLTQYFGCIRLILPVALAPQVLELLEQTLAVTDDEIPTQKQAQMEA